MVVSENMFYFIDHSVNTYNNYMNIDDVYTKPNRSTLFDAAADYGWIRVFMVASVLIT